MLKITLLFFVITVSFLSFSQQKDSKGISVNVLRSQNPIQDTLDTNQIVNPTWEKSFNPKYRSIDTNSFDSEKPSHEKIMNPKLKVEPVNKKH
jgi:hypothetical protein